MLSEKVARAENGAGNVVISTRDLFLLAKQAARAAKEGK